MSEDKKIIETNSPLYEEFAIDEFIPSDPLIKSVVSGTPTCTPSPNQCCFSTEVQFNKCEDFFKTFDATLIDVCGGKILKVNVTLSKACCPSIVTVAVAVFNKATNELVSLKVNDVEIGPGGDPECTGPISAGDFCFAFKEECCDNDFIVKVFANYKFNNPCKP